MERTKTVLNSHSKINNIFLVTIFLISPLAGAELAGPKEVPMAPTTGVPAPTNALADYAIKPNIDFEDLFRRAKDINLDIIQFEANKEAAEARLDATKAAFAPKIGVEGRYEGFESSVEKKYGGTGNAYIEWNVFNGFRDESNKDILELDLKQAENVLKRAEMNYRWRMLALYSRTQALQKTIEAYKATIADNQVLLAGVRVRKKAGLVSDSELLEFDLYDNKLKLELNEFESEFALSLGELKSHSGIPEFGPFLTDLKPKPLKIIASDLDGLLAADSSQLQDLIFEVTKSEKELNAVDSGYYPKIDLRATNGSQGLREAVKDTETTMAIVAKWELFSGFETSSLRKVSMARMSQAQAKLSVEKTHLKSDADQLIKRIENILGRLSLEDDNRTKTETYLKAVGDEYRRGVKNSADLKNATEVLLQSNIKVYQLKSDYYKARSELQTILGRELEEK